MNKAIFTIITIVLAFNGMLAQEQTFAVNAFDKIIVGPHIAVNMVEGEYEKVVIENTKVDLDKINVKVEGKTLRVYLDGAKVVTKSECISNDQWRGSAPLYVGTMTTATITFKSLKNLSIRGEETVRFKSALKADDFKMSLFGEVKVFLDAVSIDKLTVAIYKKQLFGNWQRGRE